MIATLAEVLEQGPEAARTPMPFDELYRRWEASPVRAEAPPPHDRAAVYGGAIEDWPDHWVIASGFEL